MTAAILFCLGAAIAAPVFFALGVIAAIDRSTTRERADIRPALRRSTRG